MSKYSKHTDIEAVMLKAEADLSGIEAKYQNYLDKQTVPDSLLVEVKDCLVNIRSALDYLWCKVPDVGTGSHFPSANSQVDFSNKTAGIDKKYIDVVEKWQSYNGDPWLKNFGYIRNKNVHLTLVPQTRQETKEFSVKNANSGVTMRGVTFSGKGTVTINLGGVSVPIDMKTEFPANVSGVDIERKIWVDFLFDGSSISLDFPENVSALPFLKQSFTNAKTIISGVEKVI